MSDQHDRIASDLCAALHEIVQGLPRLHSSVEVPFADGIYFFFEEGEAGHGGDRIVRIGSHTTDGRLQRRIGDHYTSTKNGSVFRLLLGGAILRARDEFDPCLAPGPGLGHWEQHKAAACARCSPNEARVSDVLRRCFSFACIPISDAADRDRLEHRAIATVAACAHCRASPDWLGLHSFAPLVRTTGLWNRKGVGDVPLTGIDLGQLTHATETQTGPPRTSETRPMTWMEIIEEIKNCRARANPRACLEALFVDLERAGHPDGHVAFAIGEEYEKASSWTPEHLADALRWFERAEMLYPRSNYKAKANEAARRVKGKLRAMPDVEGPAPEPEDQQGEKGEPTLYVVSCTMSKIWDHPNSDPPRFVPAESAYTGGSITRWRSSPAAQSSPRWLILSARYGFIEPDHPIENYDVTFSKPTTGPLPDDALRAQVAFQTRWEDAIPLSAFRQVLVIGSETYLSKTRAAFGLLGATVEPYAP